MDAEIKAILPKVIISFLFLIFLFYEIYPVPYCGSNLKEGSLVTLSGNSMKPTILNNSECKCIVKDEYKKGDIILFPADINRSVDYVLHRIIEDDFVSVRTKGDNNKEIDSPVLYKNEIICSVPYVPRFEIK